MFFPADIQHLTIGLQSAELQLKGLQQQQEYFVIQYQELCKIQAAFTNTKPDSMLTPDARKRQEGLKTRRAQLERILSEGALCGPAVKFTWSGRLMLLIDY